MKTMATTIAAMIAISGLVLAGSEAQNFTQQFAVCSAGMGFFAAGMWWIAQIHREGK